MANVESGNSVSWGMKTLFFLQEHKRCSSPFPVTFIWPRRRSRAMPTAAQAAHAVRDKRRHSLKVASDNERRRRLSLIPNNNVGVVGRVDLEAAAAAGISLPAASVAVAAAVAGKPSSVSLVSE